MKIWLITVGEPLPLVGNRDRLWRTGMIAELLAARGHEVLWWTSTVDHFTKQHFVAGEPRVQIGERLAIRFLRGRLYTRNVSFDRLANHAEIGRRFSELAARESSPDIILCSFPTIELAEAATQFGAQRGLPVVLDVRDLWPDIFLDVLPGPLRPFGRWLLRKAFKSTSTALASCQAIFAVSGGYLEWGLARAARPRSADDAVYPLAYEMSAWTQADRDAVDQRLEQAGLAKDDRIVLFSGSFGRTYDLGTVIQAAKQTNLGRLRAHIVLCGRGDREAQWRAQAAGVARLSFLGWLSGGELAYLLGRTHVGLAAYADAAPQGIPNKVIEYLAAGLPILGSLRGESRALLDANHCGDYYEASNADALAAGLERWLEDDARRARAATAAAALFAERFSGPSVYAALTDHLEAIAAAGCRQKQT